MKRILLLVTTILLTTQTTYAQDKPVEEPQAKSEEAQTIERLTGQLQALFTARQEDKQALALLQAQVARLPKPDVEKEQKANKDRFISTCKTVGLSFDRLMIAGDGKSYQISCK